MDKFLKVCTKVEVFEKKKVKMVPISLIVLTVWISKLILIKASNEVFNQCIRSPKPNVIKCIGQQTISSLHNLDKMDNFTIVSGLELIRPENARQRSLTEFFVEDPTDFRLVIFFWINLLSFYNVHLVCASAYFSIKSFNLNFCHKEVC